jgi:hypothetical protein
MYCRLFRVLIAYCLVCRSIEVVASRIALIGPKPVVGRICRRHQDLEANDYEYIEDLGDDQRTSARTPALGLSVGPSYAGSDAPASTQFKRDHFTLVHVYQLQVFHHMCT